MLRRDNEIEKALKSLFPAYAKACFSAELIGTVALFSEELPGTEKMVDSRQQEYLHGRACARVALTMLGLPVVAIPRGPYHEPLWPKSVVGSISHAGTAAAAVTASSVHCDGIGIDVESADLLAQDLIPMICRLDENVENDSARAKLLFSIKEAVYKCIFPTVGRFVDFLEVKINLDSESGKFTAWTDTARSDLLVLERVEGACCVSHGWILSAAWLRPE